MKRTKMRGSDFEEPDPEETVDFDLEELEETLEPAEDYPERFGDIYADDDDDSFEDLDYDGN
jgi:hypothetical protein